MTRNIERILHVDASQRTRGSVSRSLSQGLVDELVERYPGAQVVRRDLAQGVPLADDAWIEANFTPEENRTQAHREVLGYSDALVEELRSTDLWVIGTPIYNFSVPPVLKAWIDLICRARVTFMYTEQGPKGLLEDRKVFVTLASGGSKVGSDADFHTPYLRRIMNFIGISDVEIIAADQLALGGEESIARAREQIQDAARRLSGQSG
ncbi:MAG: FMN-dependent NADH-azoreductase [Pseudomonadota bacterium]